MTETPPDEPPPAGTSSGCGKGCLVLFAVPILVIVVALIVSSHHSGSGSEYTQTWSKDYASTTCSDWTDQMTAQQRFAASADILSAARDKIDGGSGVAPDSLIRSFEGEIDDACAKPQPAPNETLTDVTLFIYQADHATYAP